MSPHRRLCEWGRWRCGDKPVYFSGVSILWRLLHEGPGVSGLPLGDGGMLRLFLRRGGAIHWDTRCKEIDQLVYSMRGEMRRVVEATYLAASARDVPRPRDEAAAMLGLREKAYRLRHKAALDWLEARA